MTHSSSRKQASQIVRFGLGIAAAGTILGVSLAPAVLAQTLGSPTTSGRVISTQAQTQTTAGLVATTLDQTVTALTPTLAETEGPFFKAGSPEATNLVQDGVQGTLITITGQVLDQNGQPVANALLDFWQANASGAYDNSGYTLRGHQYTDANGSYTLTTIVPGLYTGRTEHIHVKVQAPNGPLLTTQLFFPGVAQNARDGIYNPSLLLNVTSNPDGTQSGSFNFVVATA